MATHHFLVLGASGRSGIAFIREALAAPKPPQLTLYVRSASRLPSEYTQKPGIRVVEGALSDPVTLDDALKGVTIVVSFLGAYPSLGAFITRNTSTPIANNLKLVIEAMKRNGVKRIMALSTPSYRVEGEKPPWTSAMVFQIPGVMLPQANAEMLAIAAEVEAHKGDLETTVFRVGFLNDDTADKNVFAGLQGPDHKGALSLSRPSMSRWLLREADERKWIGGAPSLGN